MSNYHLYECDACGHAVKVEKNHGYMGAYYVAPKDWTNFEGFDVCSKKCAKNLIDDYSSIIKTIKSECQCVHCIKGAN